KALSDEGRPAPTEGSVEISPPETQGTERSPGMASAWASLNLSRWLGSVALAYAAVSAFLLGRWVLGHCALWRLLRDARPAPEAIGRLFETMACGHGRRPRLLVSQRLRVPLSCGIIRPAVVLPASLCEPDGA